MNFQSPLRLKNPDEQLRRVGFEFEMAGIETKDCAELVNKLFGGHIEMINSLEAKIKDTPFGKFTIELDSQMVKELAAKLEKEQPQSNDDLIDGNKLRRVLSEGIGGIAGQFVPLEIVTPPMTLEQLPELEVLRNELYQQKVVGTKANYTNAFGMHINPDIASKDITYILNILRAFLILYPWMIKVMNVDLSRRLLSYIDPFPKEYTLLILDKDYVPSLDEFIDDYKAYNLTRNRALDLWPLLTYLKPEALEEISKDEQGLVKPRPTFHYRLPNCEIDDPNWRIARDWNYWVKVENLAEDKDTLILMADEYQQFLDNPLSWFSNDWVEHIEKHYGYENSSEVI